MQTRGEALSNVSDPLIATLAAKATTVKMTHISYLQIKHHDKKISYYILINIFNPNNADTWL